MKTGRRINQAPDVAAVRAQRPKAEPEMCLLGMHVKIPNRRVPGIKILGYQTNGKIRHLARSLKPHRRGPSKIDRPKTLTACQSLEARKSTSTPEPCGKVSGEIDASGDSSRLARAPMTSSKRPTPSAYFRLARGTRGTLWQDGEPRPPQPWHPLPSMGRT
jgi:hypothetical protein